MTCKRKAPMNEKKIRREIRVCTFGGWTSLVAASITLVGAIVILVLSELVTKQLNFQEEILLLVMSLLFLVLALGLAMCGALFFINRRQGEHSLCLMDMVRGAAKQTQAS